MSGNERIGNAGIAPALGLIAVLVAPFQGAAAYLDSLRLGDSTTMTWNSPQGGQLHYTVRLPKNFQKTEKLPLVVWMHGGSGNSGWSYQYMLIDTKYDPDVKHRSVLFEPTAPQNQNWGNGGGATGSHTDAPNPSPQLRMTLELIPFLQKELGLDEARCYVNGGSNGGYATWDLILYRPELFAAALPICGGGDPSKAGRILSLPVWVFHGTQDQVISVNASREMTRAVWALGGQAINFNELEYCQHEAWIVAFAKDSLLPWMFRQSRVPDTTAPSKPTGLSATPWQGGNRIDLAWRSSTDAQSPSISYYVYRNGTKIASVKDTVYVDSGLTVLTNQRYTVAAYNPCDRVSAMSDSVVASALADTRPPAIVWVRTRTVSVVDVRFSEKVSLSEAQKPANYSIDQGVSVSGALLLADSMTVRLNTSTLTHNQSYALTCDKATDVAPTPNTTTAAIGVPFTCLAFGGVVEDVWKGIAGPAVSSLTNSTIYQGPPNEVDTIGALDLLAHTTLTNTYGARVRGYLYPPQSGVYAFWISSHNASVFSLSTDADSAHKKTVAYVAEDVFNDLHGYDYQYNQKSAPIQLTKDTRYYFEILFKRQWGVEHCSVVWQRPHSRTRDLITGENLIPFPEPSTPGALRSSPATIGRSRAPVIWTRGKGGPAVVIRSTGHFRIRVYDAKGTLRSSVSGTGPRACPLAGAGTSLPSGVYTASISVDGTVVSRAILIGR
jgi:poly(3-hydroxybutyrate) depolymerase/chitodextrinase